MIKVNDAIKCCKLCGNWSLALLLAGRFSGDNNRFRSSEISPEYVAQSIINEFKENLEQGEIAGNMLTNEISSYTNDNKDDNTDDKVVEAAQISLDYCNDHEGAIEILLLGKKWLKANQIAIKYNRKDLQQEVHQYFYPYINKYFH